MNFFLLALVGIVAGILMLVSGLDLSWQGTLAVLVGALALALGIRSLRWEDSETKPATVKTKEPGRYERFSTTAEDTEVPFLVIVPHHTITAEQLQAMGKALQTWKAANNDVGQILGLEKMLEGQPPKSGGEHFGISCWNDPQSWFVSVALVFVAKRAFLVETEDELKELLADFPVTIMDPENYGYINR